jgi:hypothetical protein
MTTLRTSPLKGLTGPYATPAARNAAVAARHAEARSTSSTALKALDDKSRELRERLQRADWQEGDLDWALNGDRSLAG